MINTYTHTHTYIQQKETHTMAQAIISKFIGPTNTRGSRIIVNSWQGRTTWNYDYALDSGENHAGAIRAHIMHISKKAWQSGSCVDYKIVGDHATDYWKWMGASPKGDGYVALVV